MANYKSTMENLRLSIWYGLIPHTKEQPSLTQFMPFDWDEAETSKGQSIIDFVKANKEKFDKL